MCYLSSICFMCLTDIKNLNIETVLFNNADNSTVKQIKYVLPELAALESEIPVRICSSCQKTLDSFYSYKNMCLESYCHLKYFMQVSSDSQGKEFSELQIKTNNSDEELIKQELEVYSDCSINELEELNQTNIKIEGNNVDVKEEFEYKDDENREHNQQWFISEDTNKITQNKINLNSHIDISTQNISVCTENVLKTTNSTKIHNLAETFMCVICNIKFAEETYLQRHLKIHKGIKDFKCRICNEKFKLSTTLKQHMMNHLDTEKLEYTVNKNSSPSLKQNTIETSDITMKRAMCKICNKMYKKKNLTIHMKTHKNFRKFDCTVCDKKFKRKVHLNKHIKTHSTKKELACSVCNQKFRQSIDFKLHMRLHNGVEGFECSICKVQFTRNYNLTRHMKTKHSDIKDFSCSFCNKRFTRHINLIKHTKQHYSKNCTCTICNKSFSTFNILKNHMLSHMDMINIQCLICKIKFSKCSILELHMLRHGQIKDFKCLMCDKKFTSKMSLKKHMKFHLNTKHKCSICNKTFLNLLGFNKHMRIHRGNNELLK